MHSIIRCLIGVVKTHEDKKLFIIIIQTEFPKISPLYKIKSIISIKVAIINKCSIIMDTPVLKWWNYGQIVRIVKNNRLARNGCKLGS